MGTIDSSTPGHRTGSEARSRSWTHLQIDRRSPSYCRVTELAELVGMSMAGRQAADVIYETYLVG